MNSASALAGVALLTAVSSPKRKGGDAQSGPRTGWQVLAPARGLQGATDQCFTRALISLSISLPPLSLNPVSLSSGKGKKHNSVSFDF